MSIQYFTWNLWRGDPLTFLEFCLFSPPLQEKIIRKFNILWCFSFDGIDGSISVLIELSLPENAKFLTPLNSKFNLAGRQAGEVGPPSPPPTSSSLVLFIFVSTDVIRFDSVAHIPCLWGASNIPWFHLKSEGGGGNLRIKVKVLPLQLAYIKEAAGI